MTQCSWLKQGFLIDGEWDGVGLDARLRHFKAGIGAGCSTLGDAALPVHRRHPGRRRGTRPPRGRLASLRRLYPHHRPGILQLSPRPQSQFPAPLAQRRLEGGHFLHPTAHWAQTLPAAYHEGEVTPGTAPLAHVRLVRAPARRHLQLPGGRGSRPTGLRLVQPHLPRRRPRR